MSRRDDFLDFGDRAQKRIEAQRGRAIWWDRDETLRQSNMRNRPAPIQLTAQYQKGFGTVLGAQA